MMPRQFFRQFFGSVAFLLSGLAACGSPSGVELPGPPASLRFVTGTGQSGPVGEPVLTRPAVKVSDASGRGVPGISIIFQVVAGAGALTGDSVVTDESGIATVGGWTLGPTPGQQSIRAQASGLPLLTTISISAVPGPPASLQIVAASAGLTAVTGQQVVTSPAIRVRDRFGNPVPGLRITWSIVSGGGQIVGSPITTTDASGRSEVSGWILGALGVNTLKATTDNGLSVLFDAVAVEVPDGFVAVSPTNQSGASHFQVAKIPRIKVFRQGNQPIAGVPVEFTLTSGDATISGAIAITDVNGIAALSDWKLGTAGTATVTATVPGSNAPAVSFTASGTDRPFTINLVFLTAVQPDLRDDFVAGISRWMDVIVGDLGDFSGNFPANGCGGSTGEPAIGGPIDDIVVFASLIPIDGPDNIVGRAGPCLTRVGSQLTVVGAMEFDTDDAASLHATGRFASVVTHEMGHVLGILSSRWSSKGLVAGLGTADPVYTGTFGIQGWNTLGISYSGTPVPVENMGGAGTAGSHWRESVLNSELMTGFIEPVGIPMPLTRLTAGAMIDLGYVVNLDAADPYNPPVNAALRNEPSTPLNEVLFTPRWEAGPDGTVRPRP